jgi:hypothetical protein
MMEYNTCRACIRSGVGACDDFPRCQLPDSGDKRNRYLDRQKRYNDSLKGKERRERYESKHPERKVRWSAIMLAKARRR